MAKQLPPPPGAVPMVMRIAASPTTSKVSGAVPHWRSGELIRMIRNVVPPSSRKTALCGIPSCSR
ncbi:hypothetical protein ACFPRL_21025 [Pseudoclavibacter helvolus]